MDENKFPQTVGEEESHVWWELNLIYKEKIIHSYTPSLSSILNLFQGENAGD